MLRRVAPWLVAIVAAALLLSYVAYTRSMINELRAHSQRGSVLYAAVYLALSDTSASSQRDVDIVLFEITQKILQLGVPTIITNSSGAPAMCSNLPFCEPLDMERARAAVARFDRQSEPVELPHGQHLHFGYPAVVDALRIVPIVQGVALVFVLLAIYVLVRQRVRTQRELVWAGMARESAHQIGTPLTSMSGWLELLSNSPDPELGARAINHMRADLERLERVSHRFERIGRPPRRDHVNLSEMADAVVSYFRARVPSLAHRVTITADLPTEPACVTGDAVLLEWALESLVKNSIDALASRDGEIIVKVSNLPEGGARVLVSDNGPGVLREHRSLIFTPGFSTKAQGWGIGLSLTRRIVEENHSGSITLVPATAGATFQITLPG